MSHDGTVVAVVPVLVIRMLTSDNQRCAEALESATRKHQNFGCKVRGATWCYRKCGLRWTEARVLRVAACGNIPKNLTRCAPRHSDTHLVIVL